MKKIALIILIAIFNSGLLSAQQNDSSAVAKLYTDFSIPDVTAFTLLGVNPDAVTRPTSPKDISTDVVNIAKSGTSIPAGLAIEWAPWMSFRTQKLNDTTSIYKDWQQFKKSRWKRDLSVSFATLQDSTGSKVALGVAWCIYDKSDPSYNQDYVMKIASSSKSGLNKLSSMSNLINDYLNKRFAVFKSIKIPRSMIMDDSKFRDTSALPSKDSLEDSVQREVGIANTLSNGDMKKVDSLIDLYISTVTDYRNMEFADAKTFAQIVSDAQKQFKKDNWNAGILKIGTGQIFNSSDNTWQNIQSQKNSSFIAWGFKINTWGQGILLGQYTHTYNDSSYKVNLITLGGRLIAGSNSVHGSIEGVYQNTSYNPIGSVPSKDNMNNLRSTIGIEIRMNDGLWMEIATGITGPSQDFFKNAQMLGLGSIKYCFIKEPRYNIQ